MLQESRVEHLGSCNYVAEQGRETWWSTMEEARVPLTVWMGPACLGISVISQWHDVSCELRADGW